MATSGQFDETKTIIGIEQIASYIPENRISNLERLDEFNITRDFVYDKIGVTHVARKGENEETSDMCLEAFESLKEKIEISEDEIDCLAVCTQNPDGQGLPHPT